MRTIFYLIFIFIFWGCHSKRTQEPLFQEKFVGLTLTDDQWIDIMLQYPELIERPIVVKDGKAIIARPVEKVLDLL